MPSKRFKNTKVYEPKKSIKKSSDSRSNPDLKIGQSRSKLQKFRLKTVHQPNSKENELSIPEEVNRLYLLNVEAAQNQVNVQSQIRTSSSLNRHFDINFVRRNPNPSSKSDCRILDKSTEEFNPVLSYQNKSYNLKRKVYQSPYQKQQKIISRYVLKREFR